MSFFSRVRFWGLASVLALTFGLSATLAVAESETESVTFTLTNGTGQVITAFHASPPGVDEWEEDILGVDVLAVGEQVKIKIDDSREDCKYDFLAIFEDGTKLEHEAVSVCDGTAYEYK